MKASVVIPSYNACERLYYNLSALNRQNCNFNDFETLVVDNGSTDGTQNMIKSFSAKYTLKSIHMSSNCSRAEARNHGILSSTGDIIIFHDGDMIASSKFISEHLKDRANENSIVCGPVWMRIYTFYYQNFSGYVLENFEKFKFKNRLKSKNHNLKDKQSLVRFEELNDQTLDYFSFDLTNNVGVLKQIWQDYGNELKRYLLPWRFFVTSNCSVHRKLIQEAGLFDICFKGWGCEDLELGYRLYHSGGQFEIRKNALSFHQEHPIDFCDNGMDGILYFIEKHKTIEILLLYLLHYLQMDKNSLNIILSEVKMVQNISEYAYLVEICRILLLQLKEIKLKGNKKNKLSLPREHVKKDLLALKGKQMCSNFVCLMFCLMRVV